MPPKLVFVEGDSIKAIKDRKRRRQIRSDIIKRSWTSHTSRFKLSATNAIVARVAIERQHSLPKGTGMHKAHNIQPQDDTTDMPHHEFGPILSPKSLLSASRADPFRCFDLEPSDQFGQNSLDYCVNELWPAFRPYANYGAEFARYWFAQAAQNSVVMAAVMFASSTHQHLRINMGRQHANSNHIERHLQLKGTAIRALREEFRSDIAPEKIDEMIYAILCLSTTENATILGPRLPDPTNFESLPLESQWLLLYGSIEFEPTHFSAVLALVRLAGGITNIRSYSIGWLVFFASLIGAARSVTPPLFPPVNMYGDLHVYQSPLRLLHIFDPPWHNRSPDGGFHTLHRMNIRPEIIQTLLDISELSQALDKGFVGSIGQNVITPLLDSRSHLVYRVLSLPTSMKEILVQTSYNQSEEDSDQACPLYACARSAAQLYTLHAIFPGPRTGDVRRILLPNIMKQISGMIYQDTVLSEPTLQLTAWTCMVAAIAASADTNQISNNAEKWFLRHMSLAATGLGISDYRELREVLQLFGWIDTACDKYGIIMWNGRWTE